MLAALVCCGYQQLTVAQSTFYYDAESDQSIFNATEIATIVFLALLAIFINFSVPLCLYAHLIRTDKVLPAEEKVMKRETKQQFLMVSICCTFCAVVVLFFMLNNEIEDKIRNVGHGAPPTNAMAVAGPGHGYMYQMPLQYQTVQSLPMTQPQLSMTVPAESVSLESYSLDSRASQQSAALSGQQMQLAAPSSQVAHQASYQSVPLYQSNQALPNQTRSDDEIEF